MGTLYQFECKHCGFDTPDLLHLGSGMNMTTRVLVHCRTCRDWYTGTTTVPDEKPVRCPRGSWHDIQVFEEQPQGGTIPLPCPKCKHPGALLEAGCWD